MASTYKRCFQSHPPLPIGKYQIYGGSCSDPVVQDADIYVGFDLSMVKSHKSYPWEEGESFLFYIQDMGVPKDPAQFKKLIEWLAEQLIAKKKVHIGCIGGHGRTGMVLSALVKHMTGEKDAIQYVRKHYCEKAVESASQVEFLMTHFGVSKAQGHKEFDKNEARFHSGYHGSGGWYEQERIREYEQKYEQITKKTHSHGTKGHKEVGLPTPIWGSTVTY